MTRTKKISNKGKKSEKKASSSNVLQKAGRTDGESVIAISASDGSVKKLTAVRPPTRKKLLALAREARLYNPAAGGRLANTELEGVDGACKEFLRLITDVVRAASLVAMDSKRKTVTFSDVEYAIEAKGYKAALRNDKELVTYQNRDGHENLSLEMEVDCVC
jgi:histone H3/H4